MPRTPNCQKSRARPQQIMSLVQKSYNLWKRFFLFSQFPFFEKQPVLYNKRKKYFFNIKNTKYHETFSKTTSQ